MALARMNVRDERSVARVANAATADDRRTHLRLPADDVLWLQGVRIKYGAEVRVIDISAGGMLVETESELKPDSTIVFEVSGADSTTLVPSRVVRCTPVTTGVKTRYQLACAFKRSLSLDDLMATGRTEVTAPPTSASRAIGQKVVARFLDGRLVRGFTNDFHTSKAHLHLTDDAASNSLFVQISQLKALFFVREFEGDPDRIDRNEFPGATHGRKVEVTFSDGEVLVGTTLGFRGPEHPFFVHPADIASNNLRVFVTPAATRQVRFV